MLLTNWFPLVPKLVPGNHSNDPEAGVVNAFPSLGPFRGRGRREPLQAARKDPYSQGFRSFVVCAEDRKSLAETVVPTGSHWFREPLGNHSGTSVDGNHFGENREPLSGSGR